MRSSFIELEHKCSNTAWETSTDLVPLSKKLKKIMYILEVMRIQVLLLEPCTETTLLIATL